MPKDWGGKYGIKRMCMRKLTAKYKIKEGKGEREKGKGERRKEKAVELK